MFSVVNYHLYYKFTRQRVLQNNPAQLQLYLCQQPQWQSGWSNTASQGRKARFIIHVPPSLNRNVAEKQQDKVRNISDIRGSFTASNRMSVPQKCSAISWFLWIHSVLTAKYKCRISPVITPGLSEDSQFRYYTGTSTTADYTGHDWSIFQKAMKTLSPEFSYICETNRLSILTRAIAHKRISTFRG